MEPLPHFCKDAGGRTNTKIQKGNEEEVDWMKTQKQKMKQWNSKKEWKRTKVRKTILMLFEGTWRFAVGKVVRHSHNTHGWLIPVLLCEMSGLEGKAMFEYKGNEEEVDWIYDIVRRDVATAAGRWFATQKRKEKKLHNEHTRECQTT